MQIRLLPLCHRTFFLFIALLLSLEGGSLGTATAAETPREITLVRSTSQGVTVQLVIPYTDFIFQDGGSNDSLQDGVQSPGAEPPVVVFPGCNLITESGHPALPMQSTFIGVPPDATFQFQVVEQEFTLRTLKSPPPISGTRKDGFFPERLAEIGEPGWIRDTRVLPIQLNPVQYNPARGEVRLYHRLVVEVRFIGGNVPSPALLTGFSTESAIYDTIFADTVVNPEGARRWRSPRPGIPAAPTLSPTGPRYKISVLDAGMYNITAQELAAAGIAVETIVPSTLTLTNKGKQVPIFVRGEDDQVFDLTDEIIFYGERQRGDTSYIDPYSDENVYWLSWGGGPGLRMATKNGLSATDNAQFYRHFLTRRHLERDLHFRRFRDVSLGAGETYVEFSQGLQQRLFALTELPPLPDDSWFWAQLTAPESKEFAFGLPGVVDTGRPATLRVSLRGRSNTPHNCDIWLNDNFPIATAEWEGEIEHHLQNEGISQSFLRRAANVIRITNPVIPDVLLDIFLLNWIQIDYWRDYHAESDTLTFAITPLSDETGAVNPNFHVDLQNFSTPDIEIYGIDGTRHVGFSVLPDTQLPGTYKIAFRSTQARPKHEDDPTDQYIALARDQFLKPTIAVEAPSDLRSTHNAADYIIITHNHFLQDVQSLADFRSQQGLRTKIVDVQNIYDEFNDGILHPKAIREFLNYAYHNWQPPAPTYVFLVGDTNNDIKNRPNFVPTMQVQIPGYGSSASDHQFVTFRGEDSFPDMLIGRLPVNTRVDLRIFIERTISYETAAPVGPWHKRILMLAGSDSIFHQQTDQLISNNQLLGRYETQRIYAPHTDELSLVENVITPVGRQVIDGFNDGTSIVNYIGHGGGGIWSSSRMLDFEDPEQNLTNIAQLPLVISMTCYTGAFDGNENSLAEELLRSDNGGAVAVIAATSIGLLDGDYLLNAEIFDVIFNKRTQSLGAIVAQAKTQFLINTSKYLDLAEVFTLFGDPATPLKVPTHTIEVATDITPARTQQEALFSIAGTLPNPNFSGEAEITVVPTTDIAISNGTSPKWQTVPIVNGKVATEIQVPMEPEFDSGAVQIYAWNAEEDAIGHVAYDILSLYVRNVRLAPFPVPFNQSTHLYVDVINETAIDEMTLFWSEDGYTFFPIPVVPHTGTMYRSERPIPASEQPQIVDYYFALKVQNGRVYQTEPITYYVGRDTSEIDLLLLTQTITWNTIPPFTLSAEIRNANRETAQNIPVQFFVKPWETGTGLPNTNLTSALALENATPIGDLQILPELLPGDQVLVEVPWQPPPGEYLVTVYVDPPTDELPQGSIIESLERNNWGIQHFSGNRIVRTPDTADQPIQSPDGIFQMAVPSDALQTVTVFTYAEEPLVITNQPDITPLISESPLAYHVDTVEQTELSGTLTFRKDGTPDAHIYRRDTNTGNWLRIAAETDTDTTVSATVELPGIFAVLTHTDTSPPMLELTFAHQGFVDGDYVSDTPTISARLEDANGIDSRPEHILLTRNGEIVPEDEYVIGASPTNSNLLLITYTPVLEPGEHRIRLQAQDVNGNVSDTEQTGTVAGEFEIRNIANFPNPFVPDSGTHFAYYLTEPADEVTLKIYTITGRRILLIDTLDASVSYNEFHYDGYDADGEPLANGVYLYKLTARKGDVQKQKVGKIAVRK